MPPWPPDTNYSRFMHERVLSAAEIQTISDWVDNGIQQGNLSQAPTPPVYSNTPVIQNPDLVMQIPTYTVNAATDLYRCFVIQNTSPQDRFITKVEVIPGNNSIVHHVVIVQDTNSTCMSIDSATPAPGYTWPGGGFGSSTTTGVAGWTPGQGLYELPDSFGIRLRANSYIILQIHYKGGTFGEVDSTQVRFALSNSVAREVKLRPIISHINNLVNGPFVIPANTTHTFYEQTMITSDMSWLTIAPHMHLIARNIVVFAVNPLGDTIPLINIPDWSFHWQGSYHYGQLVHVPQGSTLYATAFYDNTVNNPYNPNNPPQEVQAGESTSDEMMSVYISYVAYQPGDENIVLDSTVVAGVPPVVAAVVQTPQLYTPYPVPAIGNELHVDYFLPVAGATTLELVDAQGRVVFVQNAARTGAGFNSATIETAGLASGSYILRLTSGGVVRTKSIIL